jgi:glycine betaine catabolism B
MNNLLSKTLSRFTMYEVILWELRVLIVGVVALSGFGVLPYTWWHILVNLGLFMAFCLFSNKLFAKIFQVNENYESQYVTAEILALVVGPLNPLTDWPAMLLISFLAMGSKYLFVSGKRHIFNPAAFGVLAGALILGQGASWWVGGRYMLPLVVLGAVFVIQKLRWWHLVFSFLFTYLAGLTVALLWQGADNATVLSALQTAVLDSALIFFATVMLVEPLTAPRGHSLRIYYGILIALVMVALPLAFPTYGYAIETSLLLGNLAFFLSTKQTARQTLKLAEKIPESPDVTSFIFEPFKKLDFQPGQYMEWTLAHNKHDTRGIRRYFTIASSPTEDKIRLVSKFYPKPSTYKQALAAMRPGDEMVVSNLDGEFLLPKDESQKLLFIAGGVGITPFRSMVKYLIDNNIRRDTVLVYANRTEQDIVFEGLWKQAQGVGLKTVHVLSERAPAGWTGETGFITAEMIERVAPDFKERLTYVSGPEPMVLATARMLRGMGLPGSKIRRDYFPGYQ